METINILCATDNNYAPYCGIMLTSLFDSNRDCHFVVYIFQDGSMSEVNKKSKGTIFGLFCRIQVGVLIFSCYLRLLFEFDFDMSYDCFSRVNAI